MNCPPSYKIKRLGVKMLLVLFWLIKYFISLYNVLQKYETLKLTLTICLGNLHLSAKENNIVKARKPLHGHVKQEPAGQERSWIKHG